MLLQPPISSVQAKKTAPVLQQAYPSQPSPSSSSKAWLPTSSHRPPHQAPRRTDASRIWTSHASTSGMKAHQLYPNLRQPHPNNEDEVDRSFEQWRSREPLKENYPSNAMYANQRLQHDASSTNRISARPSMERVNVQQERWASTAQAQPQSASSSKSNSQSQERLSRAQPGPTTSQSQPDKSGASLDRWNSTRRLMAQLEPDDEKESLAGDRGTWASDPRESLVLTGGHRSSEELEEVLEVKGKSSEDYRASTVTVDEGDPFHYSMYANSPEYADAYENIIPLPIASGATASAPTMNSTAHRPIPLTSLPTRSDSRTRKTSMESSESPAPFQIASNSPGTEAYLSEPWSRMLVATPASNEFPRAHQSEESSIYLPTPPDTAQAYAGAQMSNPLPVSPGLSFQSQPGRIMSQTAVRNFSRPFVAPPSQETRPTVRSDSQDSVDRLARQSSLGHASSSMGHSNGGHESSMGHGSSSQGGHSMSSSWEERRLLALRELENTKREVMARSPSTVVEEPKGREETRFRAGPESMMKGLRIQTGDQEMVSHLPTPDASPSNRRRPSDTVSPITGSNPWTEHNSPSTSSLNRPFHQAVEQGSRSLSPGTRSPALASPAMSVNELLSHSPTSPKASFRAHLQDPRPPPKPPATIPSHSPDLASQYNSFSPPTQTVTPSSSPPRQRNVLRKRRPSDAATKGGLPFSTPPEGSMPSAAESTARALEVALRGHGLEQEPPSGRWAKFRSRSKSQGSKGMVRPTFPLEFDSTSGHGHGASDSSTSLPKIAFDEAPPRPIGDLRDLAQRAKDLSDQRREWDKLPLKPSVGKSVAAGIVQRGGGRDLAPGWVQSQVAEDEMESLDGAVLKPPNAPAMNRSVSDQGPRTSESDEEGSQKARPGTSQSLYSNYSYYAMPPSPSPGTASPVINSSRPLDAAAMFEASQRSQSRMSIAKTTMQKAKETMSLEQNKTIDGRVLPRGEPETAEEYLQLAIDFHENGELQRAAYLFEQSAKRGDCAAGLLMYGLTLRHGWGCQVNAPLGFKYLQAAAESVVEDLDRVVAGDQQPNNKAAKNELVLALHEIGVSFRFGWGVPRDKKMAVAYFTLSADLGDVDAQNDLAFCYVNGFGCKKNLRTAAHYYRLAVTQGAESFGLSWIWKAKYD